MLPTRRAIEIKFPTTHCTSITLSLSLSLSLSLLSQIIEAHPNWRVYADVFEHPPPRLASRRPIWSDMTSVDRITQWTEDWSSASVLNHTTVTDPTIRQPGFRLPRHAWSLMNRFRTGQGPCRVNLYKRDRQIGLYMLLSLSIRLHGLHLDAQYGQESCQYSSNCGDDDTPS